MKIQKWIKFEDEIDIHLSTDDIAVILEEDGSLRDVLSHLNTIAEYLKGIPDQFIREMTDNQRMIIRNFLIEKAERFK